VIEKKPDRLQFERFVDTHRFGRRIALSNKVDRSGKDVLLNYYESVVIDYLRTDRAVFVNTEFCIQIYEAANPDLSGPHWYCDAVTLDFRRKEIFLCEISYAANLGGLIRRLRSWHERWDEVCRAVRRDSLFLEPWPIRPWLFIPQGLAPLLDKPLAKMANGLPARFIPKVTHLELIPPWRCPPLGSDRKNCRS
jgi:hypothetical protein